MMANQKGRVARWGCAIVCSFLFVPLAGADDGPVTREQFQLLQQQNELLQQQLRKQQAVIDSLTHQVSEIQDLNARRDRELSDLKTELKPDSGGQPDYGAASHLGKVNLSAEGGVAFFSAQENGAMPKPEFRIDEARLFLDAPVWGDVYFYSELDLATRETTSLNLNVGELYLDFEDVSQLWGQDKQLNIRAGRFYAPFGEEYLNRFAIDNPLISHSVSDIWGSDDGLEIYGKLGPVQYATAVQNGGGLTSQAIQSDKAVAGRLSYAPAKWLDLSLSAMRTGKLKVANGASAIWFANGWFRSIGSAATTTFHANLVEGGAQVRLPWEEVLRAAVGYVDYGDDDPTANNHRNIYYYYLEGVQNLTRKLYAAARFSQIFAHDGYAITAGGNMPTYFGQELTSDYWRLSLGLGYRFSRSLVVKAEYSFNQGHEPDGTERTHENLFAAEAAFKF